MDKKPVNVFFYKIIGFYALWSVSNAFFSGPSGWFNDMLTWNIAKVSAVVLRLFNYDALAVRLRPFANLVKIDNVPVVTIESGCNGLILMFLFAGFVIAYPGPWKVKLWFVPAGIFFIYWLNILRCVLLAINIIVNKHTFDFNHKYTFSVVLYSIIFGMWMLWVNKYSGIKLKTFNAKTA